MLPTRAELAERYAAREKQADKFGRIIVVRRLKPSEQVAVLRLIESRDDAILAISNAAASVVEVDGVPFPFPRSLAELNSTMDALDQEGLNAAGEAWRRLAGGGESDETAEQAAKNSQPTPSSDNASG